MAQEGSNISSRKETPPSVAAPDNEPELVGDTEKKRNSLSDMEKMRKEIRQLQEKRAAAMMNEVVELQRERDTAVARVKILKQSLEDLTVENAVLKEAVGRGDQVRQIFNLEKCLLEEQLYSSDLKKKLQATNKQFSSLKAKYKALELQMEGGAGMGVAASLLVADESVLERSRSMNDLEGEFDGKEEGRGEKGGSPPAQYHLPRLASFKQKEPEKKGGLVMSPHLGIPRPPTSNSPSPSPTIIPRRYKLTTAQCKTVATQVDLGPSILSNGDAGLENGELSGTQNSNEVEVLKHEKKVLENTVCELNAQREKELEDYKAKEKTYKLLKTESEVLQDGLSEFSKWVRQKIQLVEEDIDVCRVIYSLHGSLSQEAAVLRELQNRLGLSEQKIAQLVTEKKQLMETVQLTEEKYKQAKQQNELLQEKIVLLTPTKSSKQTFFPLTSSPRPQRALYSQPSSPLPSLHSASSPLLMRRHNHTKTTPTSRNSPSPISVRRTLYKQNSSDDDSTPII